MLFEFHLTRASLRRSSLTSFVEMALQDSDRKYEGCHQAVWSLFGSRERNDRCFSFKSSLSEGKTNFLISSSEPPIDENGWFELETKTVSLDIRPGSVFRFTINDANTCSSDGPRGGRKVDVVAKAIRLAQASAQPFDIDALRKDAISKWLMRKSAGFSTESLEITSSRRDRHRGASVTLTSLKGVLAVTDSKAFGRAVTNGVGRGGAFGRGFLSISR